MMKKFLCVAAMLLFSLGAIADENSSAFYQRTKEFKISCTTSSGTPKQIAGYTSTTSQRYRIATFGTAGTKVSLAFGAASSDVSTVVAPTTSVSQLTYTIGAGGVEVLSERPQAYVNCITDSGTIDVYIRGGDGL